jgi:tetratricopeptide (TPR) repeat protein
MSDEPSNAVFISYRRDVAWAITLALYQKLRDRQVDAFYDIESIKAGQFKTIILNQIAARPYFLLVLMPGTLERCVDDDDWIRREIEEAVALDRVIVPTYTQGFDFDDIERYLPGDLGKAVRGFNGQELPHKWFDAAVEQLVNEFLVPIQLEVATVPLGDRAVVEQTIQQIQAMPTVTDVQLSAQQYFERGLGRRDDDITGQIADYTEAIRLNRGFVFAYYNRGLCRQKQSDLDGAIADYTEAVRLNTGYGRAYYNRGLCRREQGDLDGAIADHTEAIRLDPASALAYCNRGDCRQNQGDLVGAIADYTEAIRLNPNNDVAYNNRGNCRREQGDLDGAIADYTESARLDPAYAAAYYNRGLCRREQGDLVGAFADYTEAIRLNPAYATAYNNRGFCRQNQGDLVGAIADYTEAIRLDPAFAAAYNNRGLCLRKQGDRRGAKADFSQAKRLKTSKPVP